jgi:hypothetical protein
MPPEIGPVPRQNSIRSSADRSIPPQLALNRGDWLENWEWSRGMFWKRVFVERSDEVPTAQQT